MEVMSSLLLCALVALLPQALGKQSVRMSKDILFNNSLLIQQKGKHKVLLNLNGQPLVVRVNELQHVFSDYYCSKCIECMERAIKAHKQTEYKMDNRPHLHNVDLQSDMLTNAIKSHRERRSLNVTKANVNNQKGDKKLKSKRQKTNKQMSVTKYSVDGEVKAVKVKEANGEESKANVGCEVYSVLQSYTCNSTEADAMLAELKKSSRKAKKEKISGMTTPTEDAPKMLTIYRKREIDNTQLPENIMPSMEEMY